MTKRPTKKPKTGSPKKLAAPLRQLAVTAKTPLSEDKLYERVADILESARAQVARTVNTSMVDAYWRVGREIVEVEQHGHARASYGEEVIARLAKRLTRRFGKGFSAQNLRRMRQFFSRLSSRFHDSLRAPEQIGRGPHADSLSVTEQIFGAPAIPCVDRMDPLPRPPPHYEPRRPCVLRA